MGELTIDSLILSTAMEDMLFDALVFGGDPMLRGVTFKALERRGLAESAGYAGAGWDRRLTPEGIELARGIADERADDQTITSEMLRDLASVACLELTADGRALVESMDNKAASAAERAAERGPGCGPTCGCGVL